MQIQEGGPGGLFPCSIASIAFVASGVSSRRTGVLVRVRAVLEAVPECSHECAHLVLQGLHGLLIFIRHRLQDRVKMKIRPAERAGVAKPAKVGKDQPACLGKQVAALGLHDRVHLTDRLL